MFILNTSAAEAASWRLGSELTRRHPGLTLSLGSPGGGQYDVLYVRAGDLPLLTFNRTGTIQGRGITEPISWAEYLAEDPTVFTDQLERYVGLPAVPKRPVSTPRVLTYRVLATLASLSFQFTDPPIIRMGYMDTSGYGGGPIDIAQLVPTVDPVALRPRHDDPFTEPGYRFWLVGEGIQAVLEQDSGRGWCCHKNEPISIPDTYRANGRNIILTTIEVAKYLGVDLPSR